MEWSGAIWCGRHDEIRSGSIRCVRHNSARQGRLGVERRGLGRKGVALVGRRGEVWCGEPRKGEKRSGMAGVFNSEIRQ